LHFSHNFKFILFVIFSVRKLSFLLQNVAKKAPLFREGMDWGWVGNFYSERTKNMLKRAMGYMLMAGAVVAQPEGERFVMHTPQPLKLPVEAP